MTTTATFSNGHTRTYKGTRNVRAAWIIMDRETRDHIASGFSLDTTKARKTAEGKVREVRAKRVAFAGADAAHFNRMMLNRECRERTIKALREYGFEATSGCRPGYLRRLAQRANANELEKARATVTIEVVEV